MSTNSGDNWIPLDQVTFSDVITRLSIDTRDFGCWLTDKYDPSEDDLISADIIKKLKDSGKHYFLTIDEVKEIISYLFEASGGKKSWRHLMMKGKEAEDKSGWDLKYLRVLRIPEGYLIGTRDSSQRKYHPMNYWKGEVDKSY